MSDSIKSDINALIDPDKRPAALPTVEPVGGYPARRGRSTYAAAQAPAAGGGIASPLTEDDADTREYWEGSYLLSSNYLIGIELKPLKQVNMTDADNQPVVMRFAEPSSL